MAVRTDKYLLYVDRDDGALKIHGPMSTKQAEGFYSGVEWVNDSALEYLGVYSGMEAARTQAAEYIRGKFVNYEIEEMGFEMPQLAVTKGELHLLYIDNDYSLLKLHGPLNQSGAEGFYSGVEWVNDSALEFLGVYAGLEVARAAAEELGKREYEGAEIEELLVVGGRLPATVDLEV